MRLRLPVGYDNFAELIRDKLDFVDKTLLIKAIVKWAHKRIRRIFK